MNRISPAAAWLCAALLCSTVSAPAQIGRTHYTIEALVSDADLVVRGKLVKAIRGEEVDRWLYYDLEFEVVETLKGDAPEKVSFSVFMFDDTECWKQFVDSGQEQLWFLQESEREVPGDTEGQARIKSRHPFEAVPVWPKIRLGLEVDAEDVFRRWPPPIFAMDFRVLETPAEILAGVRAAVANEPDGRREHHRMMIPRLVADRTGRGGDANGFIAPADRRLEAVAHLLIENPERALPDLDEWLAGSGTDRDHATRWFAHAANELRAQGALALRRFPSPENTARLKALLDHPATVGLDGLEEKRFFVRKAALDVLRDWKVDVERPRIHQGRDARPPADEHELRYWLENMLLHHDYGPAEVAAVIGVDLENVDALQRRFNLLRAVRPERPADAPLLVMPYPGGRHPRIGFLDGAIRPQRETKVSVFLPWAEADYVVVDVPEAIWSKLGLTYLAHTHVPTIWTEKGVELPQLEWNRREDGSFDMQRKLPNGIEFGTKVVPGRDAVRMEMWLKNGTPELLTDLRVQNCVMLKAAREFNQQTNDNKVFAKPYVACRNAAGTRWIITAWTPCHRPWANPPCPCLHSDPKFPDCPPGETRRIRGWLSFYEGEDLDGELARIEATGWRAGK